MDLPGIAIRDYHQKNNNPARLYVHDKFGPKVEMPVSVYFRKERQMPELEKKALQLCKGRILDIGAGAGSHALALQLKGKDVTALEISPAACEVILERGVQQVVCEDIFQFQPSGKYDTLLLLMNGIGLCGTISQLEVFLDLAEQLLNPEGVLIFDSCNIAYMYEGIGFPEYYYGEIQCRYEYRKEFTSWFKWLYIDAETMTHIASSKGWDAEVILEDNRDQYLMKLTRKA
ncbi:bifunctional 2-polyprenyl-6-hydroxyphenol methylase/3-demethylubiquinol 3-O-methyltransferase UbiG [Elizabethkingia sp. JS20170427COW]|uniref:class I SAM-dependent methyltransferase n=1 Tax=Elizabethkingia sp. JS20170427COW TaxID=2583851 RepID=UPI001110EB84|nr:class I SAM-dependent methyltransferase [Elizabethkingia sp. JS20170427COW]QCX53148.1 class I SAM-dependent methyltransferase [Elizabethkingia sp. JS20170427COW]